ncbi:cellular morphogenesis regulator dopa [Delitschia confertaspora ATCC 74209]|uniref:Cellular morphogenesis regulator dopa n=1 Tax=Delitschia confertaspora ATCC 74209 TaxID=1513339 RepID=A0A9P4MMN8_9PLEO|nr:cellular morphogenesis regulator dopa [Delitschia confertaspora ATCC 74209]
MSLEPPSNLQVFSPTGSGPSSPSPRATRGATEDALFKKDKGFRRYASGVERALALWDTAQQEWADYISFLGRLLKALQAHPPETTVIPHSDTVATRLAQCLNPSLPSGVHQKALEVYAYIFSIIGSDALSRDLNLYFPGLAPVLTFASLSVRPFFLSLLETYILRLDGAALRPALKAIILCILPGLEEETSEDFERMVQALDKLRDSVKTHSDGFADAKSEGGSSHYWQCFFLATITNPSRRQGALAFLVRRLPKFAVSGRRGSVSTDDLTSADTLSAEAESAISPEPGLLIRCFESGLSDPQILIQRGFLDLLVSHLPLDSPVLQQRINDDDLERLVTAAAGVVSRRDMSLNRRLWAWFLGPEPAPGSEGNESAFSPTQNGKGTNFDLSSYHATYFSQYGLQALTSSIMKMIKQSSNLPADRARPFRICLSLMDRWEVGGLIVPEVFLPALQSLKAYSEIASNDQLEEVMKSASVFFDGVESGLIWGKLINLVTSSLDPTATDDEALHHIKLAKFILSRFNLKEEEMVLHHMPLMALSTLILLNRNFQSNNKALKTGVLDLAFEIIDSVIQLIPDRAIRAEQSNAEHLSASRNAVAEEALQKIDSFYSESHGNLDFSEPPFESTELGQILLREAGSMFARSLQSKKDSATSEMSSRVLSNLIFKVQQLKGLDDLDLMAVFQHLLSEEQSQRDNNIPFSQLLATTSVLSALQTSRPSDPYISLAQLPEIMHPLVACAWQYLSPFMPKYHVEAVRCLWQLHAICPTERTVEAAIASIIVKESSSHKNETLSRSSDVGRRFAILWTHSIYEESLQMERRGSKMIRRVSGIVTAPPFSPVGGYQSVLTRPLLLLLDSLWDEGTELFAFMKGWLQDLLTLNKVFDVLATQLQTLKCLEDAGGLAPAATSQTQWPRSRIDDTRECLYYLKHILHILKRPSHYVWSTIAEEPASRMDGVPEKISLQEWIARTCLKALSVQVKDSKASHIEELHRTAVTIIDLIYSSPFAPSLRELELEVPLMARLKTAGPPLQSLLLAAIVAALKLRVLHAVDNRTAGQKLPNHTANRSSISLVLNRPSTDEPEPEPIHPPPQLVDCLKQGFSSPSSRLVLDNWVGFLADVLPLFTDDIFQNLIPLVDCLCKQINQCLGQLKMIFSKPVTGVEVSPESTLISLINGLEQILAKAHDRLVLQETRTMANKSIEQPQGFFGNMVSGVFASEANQTRTPTANSRLTVLLCFQDTVRICFAIWSWGGYSAKDARQDPTSAASFGYTSIRMRNRARRILEHLFAAEALECLETLVVLWAHANRDDIQATAIMGLLNVLNGSKPKHTIPAIFNALYSRTNPNALDSNRMSTLTSDLADTDLVAFLVDYTKSLEDDAMDEIWPDCALFLRDVLSNPLPHRQILPILVEFVGMIGQKVDNTNFGEQRRMRKELADLFSRLLTAVFTTRSMGFLQEPSQIAEAEKSSSTNGGYGQRRAVDVVAVLISIVPNLPLILVENDRVTNVATNISTSVIGPTIRAKAFPDNVSKPFLDLLRALARVTQANKAWRKDVFDAFNDPRFFSTPLPLLISSWLPLLAQWGHADKDRLPELLSRLSAPTTAGIMFGVGAASARQEADRKTQRALRQISLLILASASDAFTSHLPQITEKIIELLTATPASSPSSATRPELLLLLRALVLKTSAIHLAPLWPIINGELTSALSSLLPGAENSEAYSNAGVVQACKLLDQLVVLGPDDFQLMEWLFITDTIDAVYKPAQWHPTSLTDEISEILSASSISDTPTSHRTRASATITPFSHSSAQGVDAGSPAAIKRQLFLDPMIEAVEREEGAQITDMARRELVERVVRPFLGQLALVAFENVYGGGTVDWEGVWRGCVGDVCGE